MWARVATFDGDPQNVDTAIERIRANVESGELPSALAGAKLLLLVDRESRAALGVTLFESEEAKRKGDEALNAGAGAAGARASVEFYEVPIHVSL